MIFLDNEEIFFPDPKQSDSEEGLIAVGGDLSPERVFFAYQLGIFPWFNEGDEILWWCPNPRFVLFPQDLKVSKSMRKIMNSGRFQFTENKCFEEVIENCAKIERKDQDGTWITNEMKQTYFNLYRWGKAKSIEVWENEELVGGLYGVDLGKVFCGESMFAKVSNASKAGFIYFVEKYREKLDLIDCQIHTPHLESLGGKYIDKKEFLKILENAQD